MDMIVNIRRMAALSVLCAGLSPDLCLADFQYVPSGGQQTGPASAPVEAPPQATTTPPAHVHHHAASTVSHTRKPLPDGVPLVPVRVMSSMVSARRCRW